MEYNDIILEQDNRVATIVLNRPESHNALGGTMREEIIDAIQKIKFDSKIRVLVITGAGRSFCAGGNIKEMEKNSFDISLLERRDFMRNNAHRIILEIRELEKPVIACVNGAAIGAGCSIALACDMRIASEKAKFGVTFATMGLVSDYGGLYFLPRQVGTAKAMELFCTGDIFNGKEAEALGVVNRAVPPEDLKRATYELAHKISNKAPVSLAMIKEIMYKGLNLDLRAELDLEANAQSICLKSEDHREGVRAFLENRSPDFKGA